MSTQQLPAANEPGFAILEEGLVNLWPYLPTHWIRLLPAIKSYMPNSWPSQETLGERVKLKRRQINSTVAQMVRAGLLVVQHMIKAEGGTGTGPFKVPTNQKEKGSNGPCLYSLADVNNPSVRDGIMARLRKMNVKRPLIPYVAEHSKTAHQPAEHSQIAERSKTAHAAERSKTAHTPERSGSAHEETIHKRQIEETKDSAALIGEGAALLPDPPLPPDYLSQANGKIQNALDPTRHSVRFEASGKPTMLRTDLAQKEIEFVTGSFQAMESYLLFGLTRPCSDISGLRPTYNNWRRHAAIEQWDTASFVGYFVWMQSRYRAERQMPLLFPDWGPLAGCIKSIHMTMTNALLLNHIACVCQQFDLIKWACGRLGWDLELNETSIAHSLVRGAANNILQMDQSAWKKFRGEYLKSLNSQNSLLRVSA